MRHNWSVGGDRRARGTRLVGAAAAVTAVVALLGTAAVIPVGASPDSDIARALGSATVRVETATCGRGRVGTGVLFEGTIVTNRHVVEGASSVDVIFDDGTRRPVEVIESSDRLDVARLSVSRVGGTRVGWGVERALRRVEFGERVWTLGHPGGAIRQRILQTTVGGRAIGTFAPDPPNVTRLRTTAVPGDSGSPVADLRGRLVGLVYAADRNGRWALVVDAVDLVAELPRLERRAFRSCSA